ncbi:fungal-specific transcription factor domain-containing protein [Gongronella butleri]|nr:fungal-specific transcription factor domain-containing protein [Gongronella butleri]
MQPYQQQPPGPPSVYSMGQAPPPMYSNTHLPPIPNFQQPRPPTQQQQLDSLKRKRTKRDRACDLCRRKKIRCDFDNRLPDKNCSSCRGYGKTCTFNEAAKKRGPPRGYVEALENRLKRMEDLLLAMASSSQMSPAKIRHYMSEHAHNNDDVDDDDDDDMDDDNDHDSGSIGHEDDEMDELDDHDDEHDRSPEQHDDHACRPRKERHKPTSRDERDDDIQDRLDESAQNGHYSYLGSSSGVYMLDQLYSRGNKKDTANQLVRGAEDDVMIPRFSPANEKFQIGPGAHLPKEWALPPKSLLDLVVKTYFDTYNQFLPIIDEPAFMARYQKGEVSEPLLITLTRITVLILPRDAPALVDNAIDARALYMQLTTTMEQNYDIDFMAPDEETIQLLLLGAIFSDQWGPKSANWLAVSIAVKMAQDLGLHRSSTQWHASKEHTEAKKRLWWAAYVIDRWVCAALGRPLSVNDADCDLEYPAVGEHDEYAAFVAMIKLSGILGDVLRAICSPRARMLSGQGVQIDQISKQLADALAQWHHALPPTLQLDEIDMDAMRSATPWDTALTKKMKRGAGHLRLFYNAVLLLSRRPGILVGTTAGPVKVPSDCLVALRDTFDLYTSMPFLSFISVGWSLSSYCLTQMVMFMLLNLRNADPTVVELARHQIDAFQATVRDMKPYFIQVKKTVKK